MKQAPKKMDGLSILNQAAQVVQKKHAMAAQAKASAPEGSPQEEASEGPDEEAAEQAQGMPNKKARIAKVLHAKEGSSGPKQKGQM